MTRHARVIVPGMKNSRGLLPALGVLLALSSIGGCSSSDCSDYVPPAYAISVTDAVTGADICDAEIHMVLEDPGVFVHVNEGGTSCGFGAEAVDAVANQSRSTDIMVVREGYETATVTVINDFRKDDCDHIVTKPVHVELTPAE